MGDPNLPPRPSFLPPGFGTVGHREFIEIVVPPEISYEPKTVGWYLLAALFLGLLGYSIVRQVRRYEKNAYRRRALRELRSLRTRAPSDRKQALHELPRLLKRTALSVFPRKDVAPLSGSAWLAFLERQAPGALSPEARAGIRTLLLSSADDVPQSRDSELFKSVERWLRQHSTDARGKDA